MFWRKRPKADFSAELRSHLELEAERMRAKGLSEDEAYARARRTFGNVTRSEERFYESHRLLWLAHLGQDTRHAFRQLWHNKAFTVVAVATLALGIGANTAIFTLMHAVLFNTLPVDRPAELYRLGAGNNCCAMTGYQEGQDFALFSYDLYKTLRDGTPEIASMAAFQPVPGNLSIRRAETSEMEQPFVTEYVSSNYFGLFGIRPAAGNFFNASNERRGSAPALVLSYRAWQNRYARDPGIVGATFLVRGKPFTVIGVSPPGFYGETLRKDPPDVWLPLATEPLLSGANNLFERPGVFWLYVMGRVPENIHAKALEPKINLETKRWYVAQGGSQLSARHRSDINRQYVPLTSASGGVGLMRIAYRDGLLLLMSLASLVLLIACANVANLLLARGMALRAQTSLRLALGASRGRITGHALTGSVLLSLLGGAAGLGVAFGVARLILLLAFRGARYVPIDAVPSLAVLGFAFAVSLITGLIFGMAPAWLATRSDPADALRGASRSTPAMAALPQKLLVIAQAALSLVLLTGAGLLTQSLRNLERQHFGFRTDGRVLVNVNTNFADYTPERLTATYRRLQERLARIPGAISASLALDVPMNGNNRNTHIYVDGAGSESQPGAVTWNRVSAGYFETIGTRFVEGRAIEDGDQPTARQIAVVNQTFAGRYFKNRNPIGGRFGKDGPEHSTDYEIVGVVEDAKYQSGYQPAAPMFFLPLAQFEKTPNGTMARSNSIGNIALRTSTNARNLEPLIRRAIAEVDSNIAVFDVIRYSDQLSLQFNQERLLATLTVLFGLLALALASVGLYGLVTLAVTRQTAEIGVRMALGATHERVVAAIVRGALAQILPGIAMGVPLTLGLARLLRNRLFGISTYDPATLAGAVILLAVCAVIAALIPASRAARVDPIQALRVE
jgi:macrolide transport system ATP-binding/permease protein